MNNLQLANSPQQKAGTQSPAKSVSLIPTLRLRKISLRVSTRPRIIRAGQTIATIVRARIMAVAATAVAVGAGDAGAAANAAGASKAVQADEIFPLRNTLLRRAANFADTIIAAASSVMTIAARKALAARARCRQTTPTRQSFFPGNRSQNIATRPQPQLLPRLLLLSSKSLATMLTPAKKLLRARLATFPLPLPVPLAFLAAFPAGCLAGSWPRLGPRGPRKLFPKQPWRGPNLQRHMPLRNVNPRATARI